MQILVVAVQANGTLYKLPCRLTLFCLRHDFITASVMNDSPDSPDELKWTHQEPKRIRQELAEGVAGGRTPVETMARGKNAGTARAPAVRMK